jgi:hypothetical protein
VDEYVSRAESEIAEVQAARDAALATSADRAAQLASNAAHLESVRQQATRAAAEPVNQDNVSDRIRDMLQLATDEAAQTRRGAEEEAERVLAAARSDAERVRGEAAAAQQRLTSSAAQRSAEADQKLAQARTQAASELAAARLEVTTMLERAQADRLRLDAEAEATRDRLDTEAAAARALADETARVRRDTADEDFEITLRRRRHAAEQQALADRDEAASIARDLVRAAEAEVVRLAAERSAIHQQLTELHRQLGAVVDSASSS